MLKISVEESENLIRLTLEGRLVGPWVKELQQVCAEQAIANRDLPLRIDLCGLTGMDQEGQSLLQDLFHSGATIHCSDVLNRYLVELMSHSQKKSQGACRPCHSGEAQTASAHGRN
jgi:hypothetical protein